jgi:hypothetical protein
MDPLLIKVTASDRRRLTPHLTNWQRLNEVFQLGTISTDDLNKMIVIEFGGQRRWRILDRLIARFYSIQRQELVERVKPWCLASKSKLKQR